MTIELVTPDGNNPCLNVQLASQTGKSLNYWENNFGKHFGNLYYCSAMETHHEFDRNCDICNQKIKNICEWTLKRDSGVLVDIDGNVMEFVLPRTLHTGNVCVNKIKVKCFANLDRVEYDQQGRIIAVYGVPGPFYTTPDKVGFMSDNSVSRLMVMSRIRCPKSNRKLAEKLNAGSVVATDYATLDQYYECKGNQQPVALLRFYRSKASIKNPADEGPADLIRLRIKDAVSHA